ncbi:uncharacterized protein LOC144927110 [Branchiostoma floridae x Branchiostoma belcheri]
MDGQLHFKVGQTKGWPKALSADLMVDNQRDHPKLHVPGMRGLFWLIAPFFVCCSVFCLFLVFLSSKSVYLYTKKRTTASSSTPRPTIPQYQVCPVEREGQRLCVLAEDSLRHLVATIYQDGERCREELTLRSLTPCRHHNFPIQGRVPVSVDIVTTRRYTILANLRLAHGYMSSGILHNQYARVCSAAGIGQISAEKMKKLPD